jgi:hypothetical protein
MGRDDHLRPESRIRVVSQQLEDVMDEYLLKLGVKMGFGFLHHE